MIETTDINGIKYGFLGDCFLLCCELPEKEENQTVIFENALVEKHSRSEGSAVYLIKTESRFTDIDRIEKAGGKILFSLPPVLPVVSLFSRKKQLFNDFTGWIAYAEKENISLSDAAVEYEKRASGMTKAEVYAKMEEIRSYMKKQTEAVYSDESRLFENPFTGYHFRDWKNYADNGTPLTGGVAALSLHYAFGVQAQSKGVRLVPGPMGTGGGYLYSAVRAVKETCGFSDEKELEGLFVAAAVGAICYTRTNPTGEILGCTGECGVCGSMAAAAITHMAGGSPRQVESAASLALQGALGWPCDPIPGAKNQPCISRVVTAVIMSTVFADLALSGKDAVVPFHEVVDEADKLGKAMPSELKCTSCGGMCETPTGIKCKENFSRWHKENG